MKKKRYMKKRKKMNLYYVTNGYMGGSQIHVYVIAENIDRAIELASEKFKEDARNESYDERLAYHKKYGWSTDHLEEYRYDESYWTDLEAYCEEEDVSREFVSDVND
ncbi:hypothetical protein COO17_02260 [Bacillus wiedmannii]|uniref:Uncharacterized protein n=1 Tax=Bacillus wiedmannii TaxID=1890302 RepID=A0A2A7BYQ4_9BACI|nr:hypothetical protein [Bacillus wiedmannii]PDY43375.1 hypothetical protein COO17_02260 [Bacillus wiedmannii]